MFVQVMEGRVRDAEAFQRAGDRWNEELRPGATGFLGSMVGVADDGRFVAMARFADEAAARRNSDRPEQGAWFQDLRAALDGEPTFKESTDVSLLFDGGSDDAHFVQVMEGKVNDRAKAEAMETPEMMEQLHQVRPDLLGGVRVWLPGDEFVDVAYFTSETEARANEKKMEFQEGGEEFASVFGEMTYIDIKEPMLVSA
jgi:hypothetical protein